MKREFILQTDYDRKVFAHRLCEIAETKPLRVSVCVYRKNRSLAQNRLLHLWLNEIAKAHELSHGQRFSTDTWRHYYAERYLGLLPIELPDGRVIERRQSTADLEIGPFSEFLGAIEREAVEAGIELPHPADLYGEAMG
ncbi:MAG: recombination protein NinB [Acidiferrobacteraceae bacterium]